ncbi:DUF2635 domain-containing protein [Xenorhabdus cabanillasii]|uniref:DUF2635 domain-containing protein n=1 Tax=Xenorhabdus cabanillasii JM26 TaxID=1427517 RepID=W1IQR9_9GAMM|nr:DUF2635 domain-containing protein [Xenorhabdus cabanillasii]PHM76064.1 hypothetical protein Xcab_03446 [Xenorhabdus cabanillasii JM26]CDL80188.1 conserved hypothetical protein [Xenorhabdus cabanillasii JM26]
MSTLIVRAATGLRVPLENQSRRYIESDPVTVPDSAYYRRLITTGDLVPVSPANTRAGKLRKQND